MRAVELLPGLAAATHLSINCFLRSGCSYRVLREIRNAELAELLQCRVGGAAALQVLKYFVIASDLGKSRKLNLAIRDFQNMILDLAMKTGRTWASEIDLLSIRPTYHFWLHGG